MRMGNFPGAVSCGAAPLFRDLSEETFHGDEG